MNHLSTEKSPYLLQHAGNPVDWYPWGAEAFDRALSEDRPVFLSIGYSTCHWCHVMERESFEDEQVAALMNGHFICVKVDREERPDIDGVYMDAAVMMTGRGGWPLTILMTPAGRPFYAATYLPRESRFGMPGLMDLLPRVAELWRDRRTELLETADRMKEALGREAGTDGLSTEDAAPSDAGDVSASPSSGGGEITGSHIAAAAAELAARFDARHGGFGPAPKFPSAHSLIFLTRRWHETGKENLLAMVEKTLRSMRAGGIYDHVGFGFHRYSTDEMWLVPHFEKMLYDQAMLALAYTEAALATGALEYERTAREVIEYVLRDMTSPDGAFYSAEDADTEGVEGKFYVWTRSELEEVLGPDDAKLAMLVFGVSGEDATILHLARPIAEVAPELEMSGDALTAHLDPVRERLHAARGRRTRPSRDDKVLTDWNGLMISALAVAARAFGEDTYAEAAQRAAGFILAVMRDEEGRLLHRFRDGEAAICANADDYAFLTGGRLDLYETTFAPRHLEEAVRLNREFVEHFLDRRHGGFFFTPDDGERLIVRKKEVHDGALPSGNSVAMRNLIRLSRMTGDPEFEGLAAKLSRAFSEDAALNPAAHTMLLSSAQHALSPTREVVVAGRADAPDTKEMLAALGRTYDPNRSVLLRDPGVAPGVTAVAPWTSGLVPVDGRATAYVCRSRRCGLPTSSASEMLDMLARH